MMLKNCGLGICCVIYLYFTQEDKQLIGMLQQK